MELNKFVRLYSVLHRDNYNKKDNKHGIFDLAVIPIYINFLCVRRTPHLNGYRPLNVYSLFLANIVFCNVNFLLSFLTKCK